MTTTTDDPAARWRSLGKADDATRAFADLIDTVDRLLSEPPDRARAAIRADLAAVIDAATRARAAMRDAARPLGRIRSDAHQVVAYRRSHIDPVRAITDPYRADRYRI